MAKAKKLPSGNWRVQAKKNGMIKSITAPSKREAELLALEWQMSEEAALSDDPVLREAYRRYIESKENVLSPSTLRTYKNMINTTMQSLMDMPLSHIRREQIQKAVSDYSLTHSPKSVRNAYSLFKSVMEMFRPDFHCNIKFPQKQKKELYIPSDDEIKALLKNSDGDLKIAIMLGAFAGLRRGEICALTAADLKGNCITVNKSLSLDSDGVWHLKAPKSYAGYRQVQIPDFLYDAIKNKKERIIEISPNTVYKHFHNLLPQIGLPAFRFHDLRHYYVSHLFDLGLPEKYIISQVGHSSSSITKAVYDHINKDKQIDYSHLIAQSFNSIA